MMVRIASVLVVAGLASSFVVGCASKSSSSDDDTSSTTATAIGSSEDALSADNDSTQESEDGAEEAEDGLSGATTADPGTPASGASVDVTDPIIKTNPGKFFQPAGCIVSTRTAPGVWTHVFTNCTGPAGKRTYNGTIQSTWTVNAGEITVVHAAQDFSVKGPNVTATVSGARTVTYTEASDKVVTKKRVGTWTGTIEKNSTQTSEAWTHNANFTSTWDPSTKCYTRDGEVTNTLGGRDFGRDVSGYKVCGSLFACPEAGEVTLDRKNGTKITITFLGSGNYDIEGAKGRKVERKLLLCLAES